METKKHIIRFFSLIVIVFLASSSICHAEGEEPTGKKANTESQLTTVSVTVNVPSDCEAAQHCDWVICIYDVTSCAEDVQPVECRDYTYGLSTYTFTVNISNIKVRACMIHKPGTSHCDSYTHYAPDCDCKPTASSMSFTLDICVP